MRVRRPVGNWPEPSTFRKFKPTRVRSGIGGCRNRGLDRKKQAKAFGVVTLREMTMPKIRTSRRMLLKTGSAAALAAAFPMPFVRSAAAAMEIVNWSPNTASDGEVWGEMVNEFNTVHKDKGIQVRVEIVAWEDYRTKMTAAAAAGAAPDFGWGDASRAIFAKHGITIRLDELAKAAGLDLADFSEFALKNSMFARYAEGLYQIPMDIMCLQPEVNTDHVKEAGLDIEKWPENGDGLIEWAKAMTKTENGEVVRSGIMMTGAALQPTVTWGIVAEQMGFKRISDDFTTVCINPDAGKAAMQWVLDLFDKHKVSTRNVTDRYKAFGTGQGSIFWTGPWTINGYMQQNLPFVSKPFPAIGANRATYLEMGGLEMYVQKDTSRYTATMDAIKWFSDNSFIWTTKGRGVSPRKSIVERPDYKTAGYPWSVRGAFVEGVQYATIVNMPPILSGEDFNIYSGSNFLVKTLDLVWSKQASIDEAMQKLQEGWQQMLADEE
jgi:ABC-type glycerol-3-phosphate transport system substrate-binding protein